MLLYTYTPYCLLAGESLFHLDLIIFHSLTCVYMTQMFAIIVLLRCGWLKHVLLECVLIVWTGHSFITLTGCAFLTYCVADFERSMMTFYEAVSQGHHCYSNGMGGIHVFIASLHVLLLDVDFLTVVPYLYDVFCIITYYM